MNEDEMLTYAMYHYRRIVANVPGAVEDFMESHTALSKADRDALEVWTTSNEAEAPWRK